MLFVTHNFVQISKQLTLYHLHTPILCWSEFPSLHPAKAEFITALLNYLTFCVGTEGGGGIEGQNVNWPSLYSNSPPHKKYSAMHFGLWFLCTRSSSRPQLFAEWQTPQDHWNSQRARPFIQCAWATCCRSEITDTIDSFHFTSEVQLYCQLWPSNFPKCFLLVSFTAFKSPLIPNCSLPVVTFEFPKKLLVWFPLKLQWNASPYALRKLYTLPGSRHTQGTSC
jgi:hypothetical protein